MVKKKYNWWSRNYLIRLLIIGIIVTCFGVFQLSTIFTFKSNLTQIKGTLQAANIYTKNVTDSRGHESRKSELIFYLNEQQKKFYITENIGDKWQNEKYDRILRGLKRADTITVWIKKSELNLYEPKVFQIDKDRTTILEFETVRTEHLSLTIFLLFLGLGSIGIFIYSTFLKSSEL